MDSRLKPIESNFISHDASISYSSSNFFFTPIDLSASPPLVTSPKNQFLNPMDHYNSQKNSQKSNKSQQKKIEEEKSASNEVDPFSDPPSELIATSNSSNNNNKTITTQISSSSTSSSFNYIFESLSSLSNDSSHTSLKSPLTTEEKKKLLEYDKQITLLEKEIKSLNEKMSELSLQRNGLLKKRDSESFQDDFELKGLLEKHLDSIAPQYARFDRKKNIIIIEYHTNDNTAIDRLFSKYLINNYSIEINKKNESIAIKFDATLRNQLVKTLQEKPVDKSITDAHSIDLMNVLTKLYSPS